MLRYKPMATCSARPSISRRGSRPWPSQAAFACRKIPIGRFATCWPALRRSRRQKAKKYCAPNPRLRHQRRGGDWEAADGQPPHRSRGRKLPAPICVRAPTLRGKIDTVVRACAFIDKSLPPDQAKSPALTFAVTLFAEALKTGKSRDLNTAVRQFRQALSNEKWLDEQDEPRPQEAEESPRILIGRIRPRGARRAAKYRRSPADHQHSASACDVDSASRGDAHPCDALLLGYAALRRKARA